MEEDYSIALEYGASEHNALREAESRLAAPEKVAVVARVVNNTPEWHEGAFCEVRNHLYDALAALAALRKKEK